MKDFIKYVLYDSCKKEIQIFILDYDNKKQDKNKIRKDILNLIAEGYLVMFIQTEKEESREIKFFYERSKNMIKGLLTKNSPCIIEWSDLRHKHFSKEENENE